MEYTKFMADRVKTMKGSAIREMFKRMADPEIISLAGGNPASELFPGDELSKIAGKILMTNPHFSSIEELSEHQEDIIIHSDCDDMYDVARYYIEETGALGEVPASLQNYIDYQAYGRDLDLSGTFISTNHGIFEIVY